MIFITGEEVKQAVLKAGITHIDHHDCGICKEGVYYFVQDEDLFFNSSCGCGGSGPQHRGWGNAADWINMQSKEENKLKLMRKFGLASEE